MRVRDNFQEVASKLNLNVQKEMSSKPAMCVQAEEKCSYRVVKAGKVCQRQLKASETIKWQSRVGKAWRVRVERDTRDVCKGPSDKLRNFSSVLSTLEDVICILERSFWL